MGQIESQIPGGITSAISGFCALWAAIIVLRSKKRNLGDIFYLLFWLFGFLFWFFNALGLLAWDFNFPLANFFLIIAMGWLGFHIIVSPFYVLTKLTKNKIVYYFFAALSLGVLVYYLFFWLPKVRLVQGLPYVYYNVGNIPHGYFIGSVILVSLAVGAYILIKGFKTGEMSLENLSSFYAFYALVIYAALYLQALYKRSYFSFCS